MSRTGTALGPQSSTRRGSPSVQNTEFSLDRLHVFQIEIDLLLLNPAYPKEPKTLGERIRKARMDRGLTMKALASILGVATMTVSRWELGKTKPTGPSLERVRKVLGI